MTSTFIFYIYISHGDKVAHIYLHMHIYKMPHLSGHWKFKIKYGKSKNKYKPNHTHSNPGTNNKSTQTKQNEKNNKINTKKAYK